MLRVAKAVAATFLLMTAGSASAVSIASASGLSDAYNHQTAHAFRLGMQMRLAWTGDYKGGFSGDIDSEALRAIRDFQARHGMEASGVISEPFLKVLIAESDAAKDRVGFDMVDDQSTGIRVALPLALVTDNGKTPIGRVWRSADRGIEIETVRLTGAGRTLDAVRDMMGQPSAARTVLSEINSDDGFTVTGTEAGRPYMMAFKGIDGDIRGFGISYDASKESEVLPFATVASNLFDPFSANPDEDGSAVVTAQAGGPALALAAVEGKPQAGRGRKFSALFDASVRSDETNDGDAVAPSETGSSSGSGFVISRDGWVLTNAHVAGSCRTVLVGDRGVADRVIVDEANDLAAVHVSSVLAAPLPLAEGKPRLGDEVLALGFPLRSILAESLNVTRGNVSSLLGLQNDPRYLQISAPVQPGNSGGPLVDLSGRVVGVVTAKLNAVAIADATGDIPQSINFAIRSDAVTTFLRQNNIDFASAKASKEFLGVADTTAKVQDAVMPVLCIGAGE